MYKKYHKETGCKNGDRIKISQDSVQRKTREETLLTELHKIQILTM